MDEYQRLHLRERLDYFDGALAALRSDLVEGRVSLHEIFTHLMWIEVNLRYYREAQRRLAAGCPGDDYAVRPISSQPTEAELFHNFGEKDDYVRCCRARLDDGLDPRYKRELLPMLRRHLAEAEAIAQTHRSLYPNSPNEPRLRFTTQPTRFELDHPETVSGASDRTPEH